MLLSDTEYMVAKKYDALKRFLGFKLNKIKRITFLIDEKGKIIKIFPEVNASMHSKELLIFYNYFINFCFIKPRSVCIELKVDFI